MSQAPVATHARRVERRPRVTQRNTATRDRDRRAIARTKPPCGICGDPIEYALPHLDPGSYTVDHIVPLAKGGTDTLDNKQAAHRKCNRDKWHTYNEGEGPRTFVTSRTW